MVKIKELTGNDNPFFGFDAGGHSAPGFADIDGDGDKDAFIGQYSPNSTTPVDTAPVEYFENKGNGKFVEVVDAKNPFYDVLLGGLYSKLAFVDIDKDGDIDVFVGTDNGRDRVTYYQNDGNGNLTQIKGKDNPLSIVNSMGQLDAAPSFADIDGDGDQDAFIGSRGGKITYLQNNSGTFTRIEGVQNPFNNIDVGKNSVPSFIDIDKDGDLDAFIGNEPGFVEFFENNNGSFTEVKGAGNPFDGFDIGAYSAPTFADINGDGDLEAVIGSRDGLLRVFDIEYEPTAEPNPDNSQTPTPLPTSDDIIGTSGKDSIYEYANGKSIFGLDGDDTIYNRGGSSKIYGGEGKDKINGSKQSDLIYGGVGDDRIWGRGGGDILLGESGNDMLMGSDSNDILLGGIGNDRIYGKGGKDRINGGAGNDQISGGDSDDIIYGGAGDDKIFSKGGNDLIFGGLGADTIYGSFSGGRIDGGANADLIVLYSGKEKVVLRQGDGRDIIKRLSNKHINFELVDGLTYGDLSFEQNSKSTDILANNEILATVEYTTVDFLSNSSNFSVI